MNQLTPQQSVQALQLRQDGYSIRDIAMELNVPKSRIEKLLTQQNAVQSIQSMSGQQPDSARPSSSSRSYQAVPIVGLEVGPDPENLSVSEQQQALDNERTRLAEEAQRLADWEKQLLRQSTPFAITSAQHSRELQDLAEQTAALTQERAELDQRQAEVHQLLQSLPGQEEQFELFRKRARQDKLVSRYNRLLQEVLDNCNDIRWSGEEVDDFLERSDNLKNVLVKFCDNNRIDERRLTIYKGLTYIIELIEDLQQQQTRGFFASSSVDFDFEDELIEVVKSYQVRSFDQDTQGIRSDSEPNPVSNLNDNEDDDLDDEDGQ